MSKENVKAFYEAASKDAAMQEELKAMGEKHQDGEQDDAFKSVIAFAASKGYSFTVADIKDFEKSQIQQLSPEDLDNVNAAGVTGVCFIIGFGSGATTKGKGCGGMACCGIGVGIGGTHS